MGNLPGSRTENCVAGAPVNHNLINEIQDNIIAHNRAPFTRSFWPKILHVASGTWVLGDIGAATFAPYIKSTGAASQVLLEIPCEEGDRITGLSAEVFGNGVANAMFILYYGVGIGSESGLSTTNDLARTAAWANLPLAAVTPQVIATRGGLYLFVQADANYQVSKLHATFDRIP